MRSRDVPATRSTVSSTDPAPADLAEGRRRHAAPLGHHPQQRLMLDGLDQRGRGPGVADAAQPDAAPGPVQQVRVPLIGAEHLHEQGPAVAWNGRDPFAVASGPVTCPTGTPPARSAAATPAGPIRRSGTPNATSSP